MYRRIVLLAVMLFPLADAFLIPMETATTGQRSTHHPHRPITAVAAPITAAAALITLSRATTSQRRGTTSNRVITRRLGTINRPRVITKAVAGTATIADAGTATVAAVGTMTTAVAATTIATAVVVTTMAVATAGN